MIGPRARFGGSPIELPLRVLSDGMSTGSRSVSFSYSPPLPPAPSLTSAYLRAGGVKVKKCGCDFWRILWHVLKTDLSLLGLSCIDDEDG